MAKYLRRFSYLFVHVEVALSKKKERPGEQFEPMWYLVAFFFHNIGTDYRTNHNAIGVKKKSELNVY